MNFIDNNFFRRFYKKLTGITYNISYAQTGEDIIVDFLVNAKGIKQFTYLDIGANHPVHFNNTYKFYKAGYKGVCIEPDPDVFALLKKKRPADTCLNIGIAANASESRDFYIMNDPVLNTFSKVDAEELEKNKQGKIIKVVKASLKTVEQVINENFSGLSPVFVNIDVEGLDEEILKTFPFHKYRPKIFCVETVHYTDDASSEKRTQIFDLLEAQQYRPFADTYLNTIFIDAKGDQQ
jgi:FkbM family methyltransferase